MIMTNAVSANVGFGFWGQELMQHGGGISRPQLFTRVVQFGAWSPVYTNYGNPDSNPNIWEFPASYLSAMKRALIHRSMLFPYRYTLAWDAYLTGVAIIRPMYYEYPDEVEAYNRSMQFMLGPSVLVAPVPTPLSCGFDNCSSGVSRSNVWLPPGRWLSFPSMGHVSTFAGESVYELQSQLDKVPVFVRWGSILPSLPQNTAIRTGSASRAYSTIEFLVFGVQMDGAKATATVYEDDGISYQGPSRLTNASYTVKQSCHSWNIESSGTFHGASKQLSFSIRYMYIDNQPIQAPDSITVNGEAVSASLCYPTATNLVLSASLLCTLPPIDASIPLSLKLCGMH